MKIKKTTLYLSGLILIIALAAFFFFSSGSSATNSVVNPQQIQGEAQKVILSQKGYNYGDATAQAGKPIIISADDSVGGCLRSVVFNIDNKRYSKYLRTPEETLELPALPKGTYTFSCSMGMGFGKLNVK